MKELRNVDVELIEFRTRIAVAGFVVLLIFGILTSRMVNLQVLRHDQLLEQAETNRTTVLPVLPQRGQILDRHGEVLATNYSAYTLELTPSKITNINATIDALSTLVNIDIHDKRLFRQLMRESRLFDSIPIRTRLSDEEVARFAAQRYRFPGVDIQARLFRRYPNGEVGGHVIGYMGRINEREKIAIQSWPEAAQANYRGTDHIGKLGIEERHERLLHGIAGFERIETSAGGRAVRSLSSHPSISGSTVALTIDVRLQKLVEDMFGDRRGALVAIDPRNGDILALVSMPTFDPNLFVGGIDVGSWRALNESPDMPLLNRALRGTYPPGSIYKPFMALGALETGVRTTTDTINDPGFWMLGNHRFRSHGETSLGLVDLERSIVKSSNTYYYSLANDMGVDTIHDFMKPLGLGQITGIDIRGEIRGVLPSQAWKRNRFKNPAQQRWFPGETISLGIGQGYNSFTMLQMAHAMATLANRGKKHTPRLTASLQDPATRQQLDQVVKPATDMGYQAEHLQAVLDAMHLVTVDGTASRVFKGAAYKSAGKTGTAQAVTIAQGARYDAKTLLERQRNHSLYLAFAPFEAPQVVLAVVVENAGFGATHAAPIARRVFDYLLLDQHPSEQDMAAVRLGQAASPIGLPLKASEMPWPPKDVQPQ